MKTAVNHTEIASNLNDELELLEKELEERASANAFDDEYYQIRKKAEDLAFNVRYHRIMSNEKKYASEHLRSDVHAYEIIGEKSATTLLVRRLKATRTQESKEQMAEPFVPGGFIWHFDNSLQEWTFETDESNPIIAIRRHKDGLFYAPNSSCCFTIHEKPCEFYDFNF